ncbi:unnamed protein product [Sordaria macrospora k-hell]|uniref:WGS project CABT00000000 data, contig 2.22 n=1 Tax=Sordaria macrospora (strain ATCC MYA-333 / DSM 997 / K(L3346) / K-hell) TaxID=771870 RepID=F7W2L6_SORMK|nr:uncharacterized protein SMAC_05079 [Sordaria macrospora k-hell]CCC11867.1 unnamed protein product [Sordaria macrospora k-hell]
MVDGQSPDKFIDMAHRPPRALAAKAASKPAEGSRPSNRSQKIPSGNGRPSDLDVSFYPTTRSQSASTHLHTSKYLHGLAPGRRRRRISSRIHIQKNHNGHPHTLPVPSLPRHARLSRSNALGDPSLSNNSLPSPSPARSRRRRLSNKNKMLPAAAAARSSPGQGGRTPRAHEGSRFLPQPVKDPRRKHWLVNSDPEKLDAFYEAFLGQGGSRMLSDETKWLAVTHKSFDYGRRGYNTRLAFLGRQIIALETTRSILTSPVLNEPAADKYGRQPYNHAALANIDKLIHTQPIDIMDKTKIARMGIDLGLLTVLRWKPRMPEDLESSGVVVVLNSTLFAIIGAISLEKGAAVAQRIVREKILKKLGA